MSNDRGAIRQPWLVTGAQNKLVRIVKIWQTRILSGHPLCVILLAYCLYVAHGFPIFIKVNFLWGISIKRWGQGVSSCLDVTF